MKVMLGGTFDSLHKGHTALLSAAFKLAGRGGKVIIGLSSDAFAARKTHLVHSYAVRKSDLEKWIASQNFSASYTIDALNDPFGSALETDFDILVVSYETCKTGELINQKRAETGRKPVLLYTIPCVLAGDGKPVSSTRICRGEITPSGESITILK
ncbi:MAG TPA: phosphopantetheine adenylyltransferase [Methanocorpusculum sp.]|nr:phosphopantetheine adenylyltransferase [Methanocorpusculum sp.]